MTQINQQANTAPSPGTPLATGLPVISVPGSMIPGSGFYPYPLVRINGFVYQNAAPAGSIFTVIPAVAGAFIFVKLMIFQFSVATEVRFYFNNVPFFDYDVKANQDYVLDFGVPGLTNASVNTPFQIGNPFAISNIRCNAWGSYSNQ